MTNTNWQFYSGEGPEGISYFVQMTGLGVQNFVSAATGIAVMALSLIHICEAARRKGVEVFRSGFLRSPRQGGSQEQEKQYCGRGDLSLIHI